MSQQHAWLHPVFITDEWTLATNSEWCGLQGLRSASSGLASISGYVVNLPLLINQNHVANLKLGQFRMTPATGQLACQSVAWPQLTEEGHQERVGTYWHSALYLQAKNVRERFLICVWYQKPINQKCTTSSVRNSLISNHQNLVANRPMPAVQTLHESLQSLLSNDVWI